MVNSEVINVRRKQQKPIIGFCGYSNSSQLKRVKESCKFILENMKRFIINPKRKDYETIFPSGYHRSKILNSLNKQDLVDARLIGKDEDGNATGFANITGFMRLHNGAIWQQYEKHQKLANAVFELAKAAIGEKKANEILEENDIKLLN